MKNKLVVQSNILIEARYKQTYTVQELRTVLWMVSEIHKECFFGKEQKFQHKIIEIPVKKYAELMDISVDNIYRDAQKIADGLGSKRFTIKTPTGWINLGWISSMEYIRGEGLIKILVAPDLIPYIMALKPYTSFNLKNILSLNSSHAIRLYQLLLQYKMVGERVITIPELRSILGISDVKSYHAYGSIKQKILDVSMREINEKTNINISYAENKAHRKVIAVKFKITIKQKDEQKKSVVLNKKIELQGEAKKCFSNCKGNCAAKLEEVQSNIENSCYYCQKYRTSFL